MKVTYLLLDGANPEPWTAPEGAVGRRGGKSFVMMHKSAQLDAYQKMIAETVAGILPDNYEPTAADIVLDVWFWRRLEQYQSATNRTITKKVADRSNMLKAFEDALQGVRLKKDGPAIGALFLNDRQVVAGETYVVAQRVDVEPMIFLRMYDWKGERLGQLPMLSMWEEMHALGGAYRAMDE